MTKENSKEWEELSEYGELHNENCCVNNNSCDVGMKTLDCCDNMRNIKQFINSNFTPNSQCISKEEVERIDFYGWNKETQRMIKDKLLFKPTRHTFCSAHQTPQDDCELCSKPTQEECDCGCHTSESSSEDMKN